MAMSPKAVRAQLNILLPLMRNCSLETLRKGQNRIGELMEFRYRRSTLIRDHRFDDFSGAWVIPQDERRQGVMLYLHGGGYACGDLDYAKGVGSTLAVECGLRVFAAAYRLAPEHPFPAALEDALTAYRYLLAKGYSSRQIVVCGESAGGGLCYSLCAKLKQLSLPMPGCIVAISPWMDLTCSGTSYETNLEKDPSMAKELLEYFTRCYTREPSDPFASPLFSDMEDLPASLIFVGADEILLSDSENLHQKLEQAGRISRLVVRDDRWHGYLLYGLAEDREDFAALNQFLNTHIGQQRKLRWMPLDNAAKIYPAAQRQNWSNVFRVSVTLREAVDREVLRSALDVTVRRFPSIAARLRRGVFWYYLQQLSEVPDIYPESSCPLTRMSRDEIRRCALRVILYEKRIALEIFHSLTDGTGAMIFLKTLLAEYLEQRHGIHIPAGEGVLGRLEDPGEEELEDSFQKYAGRVQISRKASNAWRISGTAEPDGFRHVTCFRVPVQAVLEKAHSYHVSLTTFLCAVMMTAIQEMQKRHEPNIRRRKAIKVLLPVNLRNLFPSRTLRNFALYTTPEIDPRLGEFTFEEICDAIRHRMGLEVNPKFMSSMIATNVGSERLLAVRILPLFLKNSVMKLVFQAVGERKSCLSLSNLGAVKLPDSMQPYVERFDFILGVQATAPYNCGVVSYGNTLNINFIRNIREPELEYHFHRVLRDMGIPVMVESNRAGR